MEPSARRLTPTIIENLTTGISELPGAIGGRLGGYGGGGVVGGAGGAGGGGAQGGV